ncbi:MAG: glycosyltransferase 87 family protein [Actinomycetes bacterium]
MLLERRHAYKRLRPGAPVVVAACIGLLAFVARLLPVLAGGGLTGVLAYDDGVYFGGAEAFVFGRLPYRDFVLLHPPGVLVVLAPLAELARFTTDVHAMAAARLVFMAIGALNAVLAYHVARRRLGLSAGVMAGLFYALWGPSVYAERTTLLEPLVNLGVLVSLALLGDMRHVSRRRLVLAGLALGLATSVKLWAVVPFVVLALWVLARGGPRRLAAYVAGAAVGAAVVCAPFFVMAPRQMFRLVVSDQLGRTNNGVSFMQRLIGITDAHAKIGSLSFSPTGAALVLAALVVVACVVVARALPATRPWVSLLAAQSALLFSSPSYFSHYATYIAPALALVVGAFTGLVLGWLRSRAPVLRPVALVAAGLALLVIGAGSELHHSGLRNPGGAVHRAVANARCVTADAPAVLIATNVLARDLQRSCPLIVDVTGLTYSQDRGDLPAGSTGHARRHDVAWQHRIGDYLVNSDATIVQRRNPSGLSPATMARVAAGREVLRSGRYVAYTRPPAPAP